MSELHFNYGNNKVLIANDEKIATSRNKELLGLKEGESKLQTLSVSNFEQVGLTLHSGGAYGADKFWGDMVENCGGEVKHYWYGSKNPYSKDSDEIGKLEFEEGKNVVYKVNETLQRRNVDKYMNMLARNWIQVRNSNCVYAVGNSMDKNGIVNGGTGWAIQMCYWKRKPFFIFLQDLNKWFYYNKFTNELKEVYESEVEFLGVDVAGIGARRLTEEGRRAIMNVIDNSLIINNFNIKVVYLGYHNIEGANEVLRENLTEQQEKLYLNNFSDISCFEFCEGFIKGRKPFEKSTEDFINGKGKKHIYKIEKTGESWES